MTKWLLYILAALGFGVVLALGLPDAPPAHGNGYRVEVVGDPATAGHIAVLVPGADTTPSTFDTGLGGVLRRAPGWQAHQLATAAGPGTAVVAWLGYDPPDGVNRSAVRSERGEAGAVALVAYLDRLATQYPHATVTVIGHSYGTVVLGHAAAHLPSTVTDLVAIGSPGMDVGRVADLGTHARVWAGSDASDWTLRLPDLRILGSGHGTNPTRTRFGALPLDVHDAPGHDGYFVPGTASLASLARVVDGTQAMATQAVAK